MTGLILVAEPPHLLPACCVAVTYYSLDARGRHRPHLRLREAQHLPVRVFPGRPKQSLEGLGSFGWQFGRIRLGGPVVPVASDRRGGERRRRTPRRRGAPAAKRGAGGEEVCGVGSDDYPAAASLLGVGLLKRIN